MNSFNDFEDITLSTNSDPRCATVIILDSSTSMKDILPGQTMSALEALNGGLDTLVTALNQDPLAKRRAEVSFVVYGSEVTPATPFATVDNIVLPTLVPSGATSMGEAVNVALDALEARKKEYKTAGIDYLRPLVLLITDGVPTDATSEAAARVKAAEASKKLTFFAVGVEGADMARLSEFSDAREPLKLDGLKFDELFLWLSASQSAVSASQPGSDAPIAIPAPTGWASI